MSIEPYELKMHDDCLQFDFFSTGSQGTIKKVIRFVRMHQSDDPQVYGLGFGDELPNGEVSDAVISNNNDRDKVLQTVAVAVIEFLYLHPNVTVWFRSPSPARMRLYRMQISKHYPSLKDVVDIYAYAGGKWELFQKNTQYTRFAITRKVS